jgi:V8-like Glu-specific endopeptidase
MSRLGLLILLCWLAACTGMDKGGVAVKEHAIVYGQDDRLDVFEVADPDLRGIAERSLVALVEHSELAAALDEDGGVGGLDLRSRFTLCDGERFAEQPVLAHCSGVLIDDDLVLTAGHCFDEDHDCSSYAYVFDYFMAESGVLGPVSEGRNCQRLLVEHTSAAGEVQQLDFAIVQLDSAPPGSEPVRLREQPLASGEAVTVMGFPAGLPAKIDRGARVMDARGGEDYFTLSSDTFEGSSGSAVLDAEGRLAGVLSRGGDDFDYDAEAGCTRARVVAEAEGAPWEHATYVMPALRALCAERELTDCDASDAGDAGDAGGSEMPRDAGVSRNDAAIERGPVTIDLPEQRAMPSGCSSARSVHSSFWSSGALWLALACLLVKRRSQRR